MHAGDNGANDANTEGTPLLQNLPTVNHPPTPVSDLDEVNLKADLQQFSKVDSAEDLLIAFPYNESTMKSNLKKSDVMEDIYGFYSKLLSRLTEECSSTSVHVQRFSDTYYRLLLMVDIKLKERKNDPLSTQQLSTYNIILQAKSFLYKAYCKELLAFEKSNHGEEHVQKMEKFLVQPYQFISKEGIQIEEFKSPSVSDSKLAYPYITDEDTDDIITHYVKPKEEQRQNMPQKVFNFFANVFPWLKWIPEYRNDLLSNIRRDVMAGITIASLIIPASMAYSILAGLPPVYGLFTSFTPLLVYFVFAGSYHLQVGPTAMVALMVLSAMQRINPKNEQDYIDYAILLSFFSGIIQVILGSLRLGFIVNLLSHPVLSGFTSAAAILVTMSQVKHMLGINIPDTREFHTLLLALIKGLPEIHWVTLVFGSFCICIYLVLKFGCIKIRGKKYTLKFLPAPLTIVAISVIVVLIIKVSGAPVVEEGHKTTVAGMKVVGTINGGLPFIPKLPNFKVLGKWDDVKNFFTAVIPIILVGFLESISIAKYAANTFKYEIDANQEMFALGVASFCASFFQAIPNFGSFSRTAVNVSVNGRSQFTSLVVAMIVLVVTIFLTPLFYYLPKCALGAIIIVSVLGLVDIKEVIFTFKTKGKDCFLIITTFVLTLFLSIETGILIAVAISLALVIFRASRPRFVLLGRRPGTTHYSSLHWTNSSSHLIQVPGVLIGRLDSDLFFANISYFRERINMFVSMSSYPVHAFVLDCSSINQIDSTGIVELSALYKYLEDLQIELFVAQIKENVMRVLVLGGLHKTIPPSRVFMNLHEAVLEAKGSIAKKFDLATEQNSVNLEVEEH